MHINRRDLLSGLGGLAASAALFPAQSQANTRPTASALSSSPDKTFPRKSDFAIPAGLTYINGAYTHPLPTAAAEAVRRNAESRSHPGGMTSPGTGNLANDVKAQFAALINAKPTEISFVPNTSAGENLVLNSLEIVGSRGNVVTDALHLVVIYSCVARSEKVVPVLKDDPADQCLLKEVEQAARYACAVLRALQLLPSAW